MSTIIARRHSFLLAQRNRRYLSSASLIGDQAPTPPAQEPAPPVAARKSWSFLKYSLVTALTGVTATAGYATYAYSSDQVEQKTKAFRESVNYTPNDSDSSIELLGGGASEDAQLLKVQARPQNHKFQAVLYSAAVTVPAKAIELYLDLRRQAEEQIQGFTEPISDKLLPDLHPMEQHVFTLVLDLNETLVYSDWKRDRGWRTFKRPGVDAFLEHLSKLYEIVIYSDEQNMYVDPVVERLDGKHCIRHRLSRGATKYQNGKHYRDLSKLNRNPGKVVYISGHALESCLQPENCIEIKPWKLESDDTALLDLIPFLEFVASKPADIRAVLASYEGKDIAKEFIKRSQEYQRY